VEFKNSDDQDRIRIDAGSSGWQMALRRICDEVKKGGIDAVK